MIKKLLCWAGFHEWKYQYGNLRKCWHCQEIQGVYEEEKTDEN